MLPSLRLRFQSTWTYLTYLQYLLHSMYAILAVYTFYVNMHTYRIRNFEFYTCAYRRKTDKRIDFVVIFYVYMRIRTKK